MKMIIVVRYSFRKDKMITMKNINKLIGFSTVAAAIAFAAAYLYRKKQEKEEALVFADEEADVDADEDLRDLFREYKEDASNKEADAEEEADAGEDAGEDIDVVEVKVEGIFDDVEKGNDDEDDDSEDKDDSEDDDKGWPYRYAFIHACMLQRLLHVVAAHACYECLQ